MYSRALYTFFTTTSSIFEKISCINLTTYRTYSFRASFYAMETVQYVVEALKQEKPRRSASGVLQHVNRSVYYTFCFGAKCIQICSLLQQIFKFQ